MIKKQRCPRPVKIWFTNSDIRDQVLFFKLRLRHSTMNFKSAEKNQRKLESIEPS